MVYTIFDSSDTIRVIRPCMKNNIQRHKEDDMKKVTKLTLLVLTLVMALTGSIAVTAFAAKPTNTNPLYPIDGWWGTYDVDTHTLTVANGGEATTASPFVFNWYAFTLNVDNGSATDWTLYYQAGGENASSPRPWATTAGSTGFITRATSVQVDGKYYTYETMGVNLTDGKDHKVEVILDTTGKTAYYWFDEYLVTSRLESLVLGESTKQWVVTAEGATVKVINPSTADTCSHIDLTAATDTVKVGGEVQISATATPEAMAPYTAISWTSSDDNVATVDANGKVTGIAVGNATIMATAQSGVYAEYPVSVISNVVPATSIELNKTELALASGESETLSVTYTPEDTTQKTLVWTSSDQTVATVENGLVKAVGKGSATITAKVADNEEITAVCAVTVTPVALTGITVEEEVEIELGTSVNYGIEKVPAAAEDELAVTVSDETIVTYADGKLTGIKAGTATVTVVSADDPEITATTTVTVKAAVKPDTLPEYDERQEIAYSMGTDPSIKDKISAEGNGFVFTDLASYSTAFPLSGSVPDTTMTANAMEFAMRLDLDDDYNGDFCGAVIFRTATPATVFFSNPTGIEVRIYATATQIHFHYGTDAETSQVKAEKVATLSRNLADGKTHFYAIEMSDEGALTVWIDGEKTVDGVDLSEYFGKYYNVSENNSFAFTVYNAVMTVSDLHVYDTNKNVGGDNTGDNTGDDTSDKTSEAEDSQSSAETPVVSTSEEKSEETSEKEGCLSAMGTSSLLSAIALIGAAFVKGKRKY